MRNWRRPGVLLAVGAALAVGAFVSLLVVGHPHVRGQMPPLNEDEAALLVLVNDYRLEHGLSPLKVSPTLSAAARWMSEDMAEHNRLGHIDSLGRSPLERMAAFGYTKASMWGEVIRGGAETPEGAFEAWRNSPGHNAVMLTDGFVVAGVGKAYNSQSLYGWFWTVDFGDYADSQVASIMSSPTATATPTPTPSATPTATPKPTPTPASGGMVGCPTAGKWSLAVWTGGDDTPIGQALATCGAGTVDFAYCIDPDTQDWLGYFVGHTESSDLLALDNMQGIIAHGTMGAPSPTPTATATATPTPTVGSGADKWALWTAGTRLRGANIYQRRLYPELDDDSMGTGPVGPPYTQEDFNRLAALGANYVNISHPGLFSESPPYTLAQGIEDNLDGLLDKIAKAGMFAVISFRTGPGRSEFTFFYEEAGTWFDDSYLNDSVWQDQAAQDAWVAMWRHTAERYRNNPIVVGYDLMVEPNANDVWFGIWEPDEFHSAYADTLYDWNQLHPRITAAIREVDADTPILVGGMSYSAVQWLPYLQPTRDTRTVYTVHQYAPVQYTQQVPPLELTYPGAFDTDWDGVDDQFGRVWLDNLLSTVDTFASTYGVPVAANEFGVMRWEPGAADFMDDEMELFEQRSMNHALWLWEPSWEPRAEMDDYFSFLHGPDPEHHADVSSSDLIDAILQHWGRNTIRPSDFSEEPSAQGTVHNCPSAGKWAVSVWDGADATDTGQALATCQTGAVAAAYYIDGHTQIWSRWFAGQPEVSDLQALDDMQVVIACGADTGP
jgi:hypothetical protein